jgi:hypothetical protein
LEKGAALHIQRLQNMFVNVLREGGIRNLLSQIFQQGNTVALDLEVSSPMS